MAYSDDRHWSTWGLPLIGVGVTAIIVLVLFWVFAGTLLGGASQPMPVDLDPQTVVVDDVTPPLADPTTANITPITAVSRDLSPKADPNVMFTAAPAQPFEPPLVLAAPLPEIGGFTAVWGATGRDGFGNIWLGTQVEGAAPQSARLLEFDPGAGTAVVRGDVVSELKHAGVYREGESQTKIHSKIWVDLDGNLYFASMDETGEDPATNTPPKWGGHVWRFHPSDEHWEHLFTADEALVATGLSASHAYALGYFDHVLHQYDLADGTHHSVTVGAVDGHVSRNFIVDRHGHAYVPRVVGQNGKYEAWLVEYDVHLNEVATTQLDDYIGDDAPASHGIVAFQPMADGTIVFLTHFGRAYRIVPASNGPATVKDMGFMHPTGRRYIATLFSYAGERFLIGMSQMPGDEQRRPLEWIIWDTVAQERHIEPVKAPPSVKADLSLCLIYGSMTRDRHGTFYAVGGMWHDGWNMKPVALRLVPGDPSITTAQDGDEDAVDEPEADAVPAGAGDLDTP